MGIVAMSVYIPTRFVEQSKYEKFEGVSEGKFTKGLGQVCVCGGDRLLRQSRCCASRCSLAARDAICVGRLACHLSIKR